ncbi:MAG: DNA-binding XRE family transcriptional regulator [Arenicella sp.]|jgi:DNA-binding XRE family transcriptional regulator
MIPTGLSTQLIKIKSRSLLVVTIMENNLTRATALREPIKLLIRLINQHLMSRIEKSEVTDEFSLASAVIAARAVAGLTQEELADRMNAKQSLVARIESGDQNITVKTLLQVAEATGTHLKISFEQ